MEDGLFNINIFLVDFIKPQTLKNRHRILFYNQTEQGLDALF